MVTGAVSSRPSPAGLTGVKVECLAATCNATMHLTTTPELAAIDFDAVRDRMQQARGFPHFCIDGFLDPAFAEEVHDAFPSYAEARRIGHTFSAVNEKRKTQITDGRLFPAPIRRLHELLASDEFVATMTHISGIPGLVADPLLVGGGIHETNHGGRLDVHVDFNVHPASALFRRLNILIYFNKGWRDEDGGVLDLWDADVRHCVGRFTPVFNRAAGFATSATSWHGVTPVTCPPGQMRKSFAAYYYTAEPPPGWDGAVRSTVFRARPEERWKGKVGMPIEDFVQATRNRVGAAKRRLRDLLSS
jgi:2OG-Fe(II) oxygenase superfamily